MLEGRMSRRTLVALGGLVLLAGCQIVPKAGPGGTGPVTGPSDQLPADQQRHRIALLVPMSGEGADLGQSVANAANMALLDTNAQSVRITTYDTAAGAQAAARKALADGNRLILGPIDADDVGAVSGVARPRGVPVIAFTNDASLASRTTFVIGAAPEQAVARTVAYARRRGLSRFALLAPSGDYGSRARAALSSAVTAAGGSLGPQERYERSNTSVISAARRLSARGGFDAVLIADGARFAVMAAPNLKKAGAAAPRLLGTELWSGEAAIGTTPALRGAWFAALSDSRFRQFAASYRSRFGAAPFRAATLGYDAALLTIRVARDWAPGTPFPTARLADTGGFLGLDGPFRFDAGGVVERSLEVREARAGSVAVISPAPDRFTD